MFRDVVIERVTEETQEAKTFVLRPATGSLRFEAGQFLTFVFRSRRGVERRSYSISSSPEAGEPLAVTVKRIPNGEFSRPLLEAAEPGDRLTIAGGSSGFFVLPKDMTPFNQVILLAAGSGIGPVFSLLKSLLIKFPEIRVLLVYSNRSPETTIFKKDLLAWEARHPGQLEIRWLFSNSQDLWKARLNKLVLQQILNERVTGSPERTLVYLCGPFDYMRMAPIVLQAHGIPPANIRREVFTPFVPVKELRPPDTLAHQVTIRMVDQLHTTRVQYPESILAAFRRQGIELPYSCEAGRCGSCVATCTSGTVWMKFNEVLTEEEVRKGRVLICNGFPVGGDVSIDFHS